MNPRRNNPKQLGPDGLRTQQHRLVSFVPRLDQWPGAWTSRLGSEGWEATLHLRFRCGFIVSGQSPVQRRIQANDLDPPSSFILMRNRSGQILPGIFRQGVRILTLHGVIRNSLQDRLPNHE